jgi:hypothetical protein
MRRLLTLFVLVASAFSATGAPREAPPGSFLVLCYHEVRDDVRDVADPYAIDAAELASQFAWLRAHGFRPVSLDDVLAARRGERAPEKAVPSPDDGYRTPTTAFIHCCACTAIRRCLRWSGAGWRRRPPSAYR